MLTHGFYSILCTADKEFYCPMISYMCILLHFCAGILAGMRPCGTILFVTELFISESLSQVYGYLHNYHSSFPTVSNNIGKKQTQIILMSNSKVTMPEYIIIMYINYVREFSSLQSLLFHKESLLLE